MEVAAKAGLTVYIYIYVCTYIRMQTHTSHMYIHLLKLLTRAIAGYIRARAEALSDKKICSFPGITPFGCG